MEEILASIRRIISEDEPAAAPEAGPAAVAEPEPAPAPAAPPAPEPVFAAEPEHHGADDILELTEPVPEDSVPLETHGDVEVHAIHPAAPAPEPAYEPLPELEPLPPHAEEPLLSNAAAASASSAFGQLSQHVAMPLSGRTLEDLVRELLKPQLKAWLDANLPAIVQAKVEEEVERIARRRLG
jgi:cell pole-organizing protein PopZ